MVTVHINIQHTRNHIQIKGEGGGVVVRAHVDGGRRGRGATQVGRRHLAAGRRTPPQLPPR